MSDDARAEMRGGMVDIGGKPVTDRRAVAAATVSLSPQTKAAVMEGTLPKGDALAPARVAGIMAAKKTADLIPLCHPIGLSSVAVGLTEIPEGIRITAQVTTSDRTGVEMEALTAAAVAALTIYDMVKGVERGARVSDLRLLEKSGGASGDYRADD